MNASEQRARHTAIAQAEACLTDLQVLLEELDRRTSLLAEVTKEVDERIVAMGAQIKKAYDAQENQISNLRLSVGQLQIRTALLKESTFGERLRWMLTGTCG